MRVAVYGNGPLARTIRFCLNEVGYNLWPAQDERDVVWLAWDTPLANGKADTKFVFDAMDRILAECGDGQLVLVSSQLPVGSIAKLQTKYPKLIFACSPENLRTGKEVECFKNPGRVIIGIEPTASGAVLRQLFEPFCANIIWCTIESAEFAKHALNAWLSMSIAFANEMGNIAMRLGASPAIIETALKTDERVGPKAYVRYGDGPGEHLSRDVTYLLELAPEAELLYGIQNAHFIWRKQ